MKIFVMVGTHKMGFVRLLEKMDELGKKHDVVMQIGYSDFKPMNAKYFKFCDFGEYLRLHKWADVIVTHGGLGGILDALQNRKPLIVAPRMKRYGEHTNDHQLDITKEVAKEGLAIAVYDMGKMEDAIRRAAKFRPKMQSGATIKMIQEYLGAME